MDISTERLIYTEYGIYRINGRYLNMNTWNLNFPSLCLFIEPGDCDREARAGDRRGILALTAAAGTSCSCVSWLMCRLVTWSPGASSPWSVTMSQCVFCFSPHQNNRWAWAWDSRLAWPGIKFFCRISHLEIKLSDPGWPAGLSVPNIETNKAREQNISQLTGRRSVFACNVLSSGPTKLHLAWEPADLHRGDGEITGHQRSTILRCVCGNYLSRILAQ